VNVLQCVVRTGETEAWPTPTYRVFDLYGRHMGADALRATVGTDEREIGIDGERVGVPLVSASASANGDGILLTLSYRGLDSREIRIDADGVSPAWAEASALFEDREPAAHATAENAASFPPVDVDAGNLFVEAPPAVVAVELGG